VKFGTRKNTIVRETAGFLDIDKLSSRIVGRHMSHRQQLFRLRLKRSALVRHLHDYLRRKRGNANFSCMHLLSANAVGVPRNVVDGSGQFREVVDRMAAKGSQNAAIPACRIRSGSIERSNLNATRRDVSYFPFMCSEAGKPISLRTSKGRASIA
jgi:hypothetical protein